MESNYKNYNMKGLASPVVICITYGWWIIML